MKKIEVCYGMTTMSGLTSNIPSVQPPCPCCSDWTISKSRSTLTLSAICRPPGAALDPDPCSPERQTHHTDV